MEVSQQNCPSEEQDHTQQTLKHLISLEHKQVQKDWDHLRKEQEKPLETA